MNQQWNRRDVLKGLVATSTALVIPPGQGTAQEAAPPGQVEVELSPVSAHTFRFCVLCRFAATSAPEESRLLSMARLRSPVVASPGSAARGRSHRAWKLSCATSSDKDRARRRGQWGHAMEGYRIPSDEGVMGRFWQGPVGWLS